MADEKLISQARNRWEALKKDYAKFHNSGAYKPHLVTSDIVARAFGISNDGIVKMFTAGSALYNQGSIPKEIYEPFVYPASELGFSTQRAKVYDLTACQTWRLDNEAANKGGAKDKLARIREQREQMELGILLKKYVSIASVNDALVPLVRSFIERLYYAIPNTYLQTNGMDNEAGLEIWTALLDKIFLDAKRQFENYGKTEENAETQLNEINSALDRLD